MSQAVYVVLSVGYWLVLFFLAGWCTGASNRVGWEWRKGKRGNVAIWVVIMLIRFAILVTATWAYMGWSMSHR